MIFGNPCRGPTILPIGLTPDTLVAAADCCTDSGSNQHRAESQIIGTFRLWFESTRSRATHPGPFVDQRLDSSLRGGNVSAGGGVAYDASFSAEIVKKK